MSLKNNYLFAGLILWIILWFDAWTLRLLGLFLLLSIYYLRRKRPMILFGVVLLVFSFITLPPSIKNQVIKDPIVHIEQVKSNYVIANTGNERLIIYNLKDAGIDDIYEVKGSSKQTDSLHNFYGFSFDHWLKQKGITQTIDASTARKVEVGTSLRARLFQRAASIKDTNIREWMMQTLYGIQSDDVKLNYLISSSGMHIAFLAYLLRKLLARWMKDQHAHLFAFLLMFLSGYLFVFSDALIRVLIFQGCTLLCRNVNAKDRLGISMLACMVIQPSLHHQLSFILPVLFRFADLFDPAKTSRFFKQFLILIPIQLIYFYECDLIQIICFRFQRILFSFAYLGALLILFLPSLSFLASFFITLQDFVLSLRLPSITILGSPNRIWLVLWFLYTAHVLTHHHRKYYIKLLLLLLYQQYAPLFFPFYEVMFIDVGQGDCALITLPFQQGTMLIDVAGSKYKNIPEDILQPIFKAKGIEHIDLVVISHDDYDHSGGLKELKQFMKVEKVVKEKREHIFFGPLRWNVLLHDVTYPDKNENSLVLYGRIEQFSFMFTGDAGIPFEQDLINKYPKLQADVLKVGHHGSNTSSSMLFLQQLSPRFASISCAKQNRYHHPSPETIDNLEKLQIPYRISGNDGAQRIWITPWGAMIYGYDHRITFLKNR